MQVWSLLKTVHRDQKGAVSIETVLIIAAIALPILIFVIKYGWPRIKQFWNQGMDSLETGVRMVPSGSLKFPCHVFHCLFIGLLVGCCRDRCALAYNL